MTTTAEVGRLHAAVKALERNTAVSTPVLVAATREQQWTPGLTERVIDCLSGLRDQLMDAGVDPDLLPTTTASAPARAPEPEPDQPLPKLSAAGVLDCTDKSPLTFEGTLDGLRGVSVAELSLQDWETQRLEAAGVSTVHDVLMRIPLRYIDRSDIYPINQLRVGETVATAGTVTSTDSDRRKDYSRIRLRSGNAVLTCMMRGHWHGNRFQRGDQVLAYGEVTQWHPPDGGPPVLQMQHPMLTSGASAAAPVVAVYPQSQTHRVSTWLLSKAAIDALQRLPDLSDPLPEQLRSSRNLMSRLEAVRAVHIPDTLELATAGRDRMAYDELLRMQLAMGVLRHHNDQKPSPRHQPTGKLTRPWLAGLPWPLTGAQARVLKEIANDLRAHRPMQRLLQGDVGAGKTAVCIATLLMAVEFGHQGALMAPTGVLVGQHVRDISAACAPLGVVVEQLPKRTQTRARRDMLARLKSGDTHIVIGTTGLLSDDVEFASLGVAVIDEQHRFGVEQRAALRAKAPGETLADELGVTATPIPRTAALTQWGDTDLSIIDELPPGRTPVRTNWIQDVPLSDPTHEHWSAVRAEVSRGRQGYIVCPLVENPATKSGEESEAQAAAAVQTAHDLEGGALAGLRVGVITGRQKSAERTEVMAKYVEGNIDILVATTVIEVGVSVANATTITVLDAGRFGIAQLHQLRGRVGRGTHPGRCTLTGELSDIGRKRVDALCISTDGFELANIDLTLRGPGSLAGSAQAGHRAGLQVADLLEDEHLMIAARDDARSLLVADPFLQRRPGLRAEVQMALGSSANYLTKG